MKWITLKCMSQVTAADTGIYRAVDPATAEQYRSQGWWTGEQLIDRFQRFVAEDPDRVSVVDDAGASLTRRRLWDQGAELSTELRAGGIGRGDVVLIYLPNTVAWQIAFVATLQLGAIPATLPVSSDEATVEHVVNLIGAQMIVAPKEFHGRSMADRAHRVMVATGRVATVLTFDADGTHELSEIAGEPFAPIMPPAVDHLMFTSSTTGMPKAVMHTSDTLGAVNIAFAQRFGIDENTPIFMPSPLGHSVGAWHGGRFSLFTGAPLILQGDWDPVRALEICDEHRCAFIAAATPFLKDIVDAPWPEGKPKLSTVRTFLCGGAPVPPSLLEAAEVQAPNTFATVLWGMTEGTGTTCVPESSRDQLVGTAGMPVPNLELAINDPDDSGQGELIMRGAGVFVGYFGQDDLYRQHLTGEGWFRTGDLARIGDDGYLRLTGRLKDMIIRGGVNISPVPIEDMIAAYPNVRRVAVVGRPDERLGERICAVVVPAETPFTLEELNAWLRDQGLSDRKLPESLVVVEQMPVTAAGKIRKNDLRRNLEEQQ